jgi:secreted trypsin-like serine protease
LDDKYIIPACVDESGKIDVSNKVTLISGWGAQKFGGRGTSLKYQVNMKIFAQSKCKTKYQVMFNEKYQICGGESNANSGACQGDSGGPLSYYNEEDDSWYVVGLVSWGYGCRFCFF